VAQRGEATDRQRSCDSWGQICPRRGRDIHRRRPSGDLVRFARRSRRHQLFGARFGFPRDWRLRREAGACFVRKAITGCGFYPNARDACRETWAAWRGSVCGRRFAIGSFGPSKAFWGQFDARGHLHPCERFLGAFGSAFSGLAAIAAKLGYSFTRRRHEGVRARRMLVARCLFVRERQDASRDSGTRGCGDSACVRANSGGRGKLLDSSTRHAASNEQSGKAIRSSRMIRADAGHDWSRMTISCPHARAERSLNNGSSPLAGASD